MNANIRRWGVFNLVGVAGYVVQIATIAFLTRICGWSALASTAFALEVAALQNFVGHSRWTWCAAPTRSVQGTVLRFWRYQLAKTGSLAANLGLTTILIYFGLPPEIANTAAVLLCAVPNYLVADRFVFSQSS